MRHLLLALALLMPAGALAQNATGVSVSKGNGYGVLSVPDGANISKATGYGVLSAPDGANISKAVGYAVLSTETKVAVSKAVAYAVIAPPAGAQRPVIMIITRAAAPPLDGG